MDQEALLQAVGSLQAEMGMMRQIVKILLVQHALTQNPEQPALALDKLRELLLPAFANAHSHAEHWQNDVARDCLDDQLDSAKIILTAMRE